MLHPQDTRACVFVPEKYNYHMLMNFRPGLMSFASSNRRNCWSKKQQTGPQSVRMLSLAAVILCAFLCDLSNASEAGTTVSLDNHTDSSTAIATNNDRYSAQPLSLVPSAQDPAFLTNTPGSRIIQREDGTVYEGEVLGNKPNGKGVLTDQLGTNQRGVWRYGEPYKLTGKAVYPDGTTEVGTWSVDGTKSGGTITWKDGRHYQGDWKIGVGTPELPHGTGEMAWPDGRKYVGQFYDGKMDGEGKMTYPDGKVESGLWKNDKFMGSPK
jgi:hypothetical protein